MSSIRFKSSSPTLTTELIRELRAMTSLGISELRQRAQRGEALAEFRIFGRPWDETRRSIRQLLDLIESRSLPLLIFEFRDPPGFPATEQPLTPAQLRERFETWKGIANETRMLTELEEGYIQSPEEFVPDEDDA